jgi:hypothetical protein
MKQPSAAAEFCSGNKTYISPQKPQTSAATGHLMDVIRALLGFLPASYFDQPVLNGLLFFQAWKVGSKRSTCMVVHAYNHS